MDHPGRHFEGLNQPIKKRKVLGKNISRYRLRRAADKQLIEHRLNEQNRNLHLKAAEHFRDQRRKSIAVHSESIETQRCRFPATSAASIGYLYIGLRNISYRALATVTSRWYPACTAKTRRRFSYL